MMNDNAQLNRTRNELHYQHGEEVKPLAEGKPFRHTLAVPNEVLTVAQPHHRQNNIDLYTAKFVIAELQRRLQELEARVQRLEMMDGDPRPVSVVEFETTSLNEKDAQALREAKDGEVVPIEEPSALRTRPKTDE